MNTESVLKQFGLDEKEIKVYLSLLQLGRGTVLAIAKKAMVKRPTAYLVLETLMEKGLISKIPKKNKTSYVAENPEKLLEILEHRKKQIIKVMPDFLSIFNVNADKPAVKMYEGREGVNQVYDEIMQAKEIWWYGNLSTVYSDFHHVFEKFEKLLKAKKIIGRDFVGNSDFEKKYAQTSQRANHEIRISNLPIEIDFSLFGDKVAILSLKENIYAVTIQDKKISNSFRSLYELAWRQAGKYKK